MPRIIQSPGKYIQGAGVISKVGQYTQPIAQKVMAIVDPFVLETIDSQIRDSFKQSGTEIIVEAFQGECSRNEIERLLTMLKQQNCNGVAGFGGGKTIDVAKAPARLLAAGIGDALATYFEARACYQSRATTMAGGRSTEAAMSIARLCYDILLEDGHKAMLAVERQVATEAVERVVEANTYLSGVGFESGGLAAAHAIHNGMTAVPEFHEFYHGEKVAFGTLVQLILEDAPTSELKEVCNLCSRVGLPITLAQLNILEGIEQKMMATAQAACAEGETIHNMPDEMTPDKVYAALIAADQYGTSYLNGKA